MTNTPISGIADMRFKMTTDAKSPEQIIELADSLSQIRWNEGLDSLDLGDSMGAFMRAAVEDFYAGDFDSVYMGDGIWVRIDIELPLFEWEGLPE